MPCHIDNHNKNCEFSHADIARIFLCALIITDDMHDYRLPGIHSTIIISLCSRNVQTRTAIRTPGFSFHVRVVD